MTLFVCIDDRSGMMFNHRRQSRDREQIADMLREVGERRLLCHPYSAALLKEHGVVPQVNENFLSIAEAGDCCFAENVALLPYAEKIDTLIVYKWNRTYPRDTVLDLPLPGALRLCETTDFVGFSHEKITKERYER